jgi:hypothetical protein
VLERAATGLGLSAACLALSGCGFVGGAPKAPALATPADPTPLARCKVAASSTSPLVTEWPASQKAHLEGLMAHQAVAVAYSGCELRVVDTCHLAGRYAWRRTTPATDTLEIADADDLWAKLPIGAAGLEGELARSGHLAVRTTVSGQLELDGLDAHVPADGACAGVTHVISAVSVGAFRLLSGADSSARGGATVGNAGAGGRTSSEEKVMREAGDPGACSAEADAAPRNCASPIQIFLQPVVAPGAAPPQTAGAPPGSPPPTATSALAVEVEFPAVDDRHWSLHDANGTILCDVPCTGAVAPGSGWYLERIGGTGGLAHIDLPARLPYSPGTHVVADYHAERGQPFLSALTFWGLGVPAAIGGAVSVSFGLAGVGNEGSNNLSGFWIGSGIMFLAVAGAATWWWLWSHPASFDTHTAAATP